MNKTLIKYFIGILVFFMSINNSKAANNTPQMIGEYKDWVAYYVNTPEGTICYIASTPKREEGKYTARGDIYAVVTHRPRERSYDVVNFVAGYKYKQGAKVTVKIGNNTIEELFTEGDKAWAVNEDADKTLVNAMKKGQRMIVYGTSSRGTVTKDTYSLAGFVSAYKAINSKCKR